MAVQQDLMIYFKHLTGRDWEKAKSEDLSRMCTCIDCKTVYYSSVVDSHGLALEDPRKIHDYAESSIRIQPCPSCNSINIRSESLVSMSRMMRFHDTVMALHTSGTINATSLEEEVSEASKMAEHLVWTCSTCGNSDNSPVLPHCEKCFVRRVYVPPTPELC